MDSLPLLAILSLLFQISKCSIISSMPSTCPCSDPLYCSPLETAARLNPEAPHVRLYTEKKNKYEVFAFVLPCNASVWEKFDWRKLTTIVPVDFNDPILTCHAHSFGVKVAKIGNIPKDELADEDARKRFIALQMSVIALQFMDGINIDFEEDVADGSPEQEGLTLLVQELTQRMHDTWPNSEVSVDVAWSPKGIDGRYYDYTALGQHADLLFVMAYDEQSQIWDPPCSARANSGFKKSMSGVDEYLELGIPPSKLVLGVPWYGYQYPCTDVLQNGTCLIKEVPFRGCPCSDAAGKQFPYSYVRSLQKQYHAAEVFEQSTKTPYYQVSMSGNQTYEMRFDSPVSVLYKVVGAVVRGVRGVGMWTANFLDYSDTEEGKRQQHQMWGVLP